jgi:tyrosine-protein phosphatase SIW14
VDDVLKHINESNGAVVVHCWHGADRTGSISAAKRIKEQNWSNDEALSEILHTGFGYHSLFSNLKALGKNFKPIKTSYFLLFLKNAFNIAALTACKTPDLISI